MQREKARTERTQPPASRGEAPHAAAQSAPPLVPARWIAAGVLATVLAAALCAWCTLCVLFWQGSWQLLFHPKASVARTPASINLSYETVGFASDEAGQPRLSGWWIPASPDALTARFNRYTVIYLHGAAGNLGDTLDALAMLHQAGVNLLAFDYRGYGQSQFVHPSEARWRQDAGWALAYLTGTRHVAAANILLYGDGLGANLALEVAAGHPELGGVVLQQPVPDLAAIIFSDPRAQLVPAHLLARDRFSLDTAAMQLRIPSLWLEQALPPGALGQAPNTKAFLAAGGAKKLAWLRQAPNTEIDCRSALLGWMDALGR